MANLISMKDFLMDAERKQMLLTSPEFISALNSFLRDFELVFGETDWPATLANLQNEAKYFIDENGTFLEPGVCDESNNWWNRGNLLASYRRLKAMLEKKHFNFVMVHPCGMVSKAPPEQTDIVI